MDHRLFCSRSEPNLSRQFRKILKECRGGGENDSGGSTCYKVCDFEKVLITLIL